MFYFENSNKSKIFYKSEITTVKKLNTEVGLFERFRLGDMYEIHNGKPRWGKKIISSD